MIAKVKYMLSDLPKLDALWRYHRKWRNRYFVSTVDHQNIIGLVEEDGVMTSRYGFMVTMACAIAILGLLLSSPAVIIGAMLISPLMGPIMCLGFSFCVVDMVQLKKALKAIIIGFILSVAIAMFVVLISPITDPTPEIMARTSPNLFDLLVAIFSGLAGGYATIKQKGATIVGVAIATALMPPLAVVGYGLATTQWVIAERAFFLFMTNLLAISLTVAMLAKWYGFKSTQSQEKTLWQTILVFVVFVVLSIPLGLSLSKIAYQSYVTKAVKSEIQSYFSNQSSRTSNFSIAFNSENDVIIDTIIITNEYVPMAQSDIQSKLIDSLDQNVHLTLDQIIVAKEKQEELAVNATDFDSALTNNNQAGLNQSDDIVGIIRSSLYFPIKIIEANPTSKIITIYPEPSKSLELEALQLTESQISQRYPDWSIRIIPPVRSLPPIFFGIGSDDITQEARVRLSQIIWVLNRWGVKEINVYGFASTVGATRNNQSLAARRAQNIATFFSENGFLAQPIAEYQGLAQKRIERDEGINRFHRVEIRLP